jgi:hypothetical protein
MGKIRTRVIQVPAVAVPSHLFLLTPVSHRVLHNAWVQMCQNFRTISFAMVLQIYNIIRICVCMRAIFLTILRLIAYF